MVIVPDISSRAHGPTSRVEAHARHVGQTALELAEVDIRLAVAGDGVYPQQTRPATIAAALAQ